MGSVPSLPESLMKNQELVTDLCRFAEGIATEAAVRKKWRLQEEAWTLLGESDEFTRAVEKARVQRIRSGACKRERAQQLIAEKGASTLDRILSDERSNPRHKIDAVKALDDLAGFAPQRPAAEEDRVVIRIDLSADTKNPADVLTFEAVARPNKPSDDTNVIDATPSPIRSLSDNTVDELPPVRRGPGRPKGSRNKPKVVDERPKCVPGFDV